MLLAFLCLGFSASVAAQGFERGPQSQILVDSIYSTVLDANRAYTVYLPKSYETSPDRQYPIVYLLHGMLDTNAGWNARGHLQEVIDPLIDGGEAADMIIVTPNAGGNIYEGVWNGYFNMPGWNYEDFFFQEFMPHIESTYRVIGDKQNRAIGGLSMGGGGSTVYAQRHPDLFGSCYAMSALMDLPDSGQAPPPGQEKMQMLTQAVRELSAVDYVKDASPETVDSLKSVDWFVDCGDDDFLFDCNIDFFQAMRNAGIPCQLRVRDGGHTWEYWNSALYTALPYFSRKFKR